VKPKILHVSQATGGVETSLLLLLGHLSRDRFELHLACPPGTLAAGARALDIPVFEIPMVRSVHPIRDGIGLGQLVALIRRARYAIVHGHSAKGGYLARVAGRLSGNTKTVYHPRAFSYLSQRGAARAFFLRLERMAIPLTDLLIATSDSERTRAIEEVGFPPSRAITIHNSVDFAEINGDRAENRGQPPLVLTVGRLSYQKNPEMFVRVAKLVVDRVPEAKFIILGAGFSGPLESRVRDLIVQGGLEHRVTILPWANRAETLEHIGRCDVFVLTSRFEGMPNTLLEALMLGRAVVVTDVDGSRDVVAAASGATVPVDDDAAMSARIIGYLTNPGLARREGEKGRQRIKEEFGISGSMTLLQNAYEGLLTRS